MVRTRPRDVPNDREIGRRFRRASVAPTGEELRRHFHQLTLEEQRRLFDNSAPTSSTGRIPWHRAAASRSWIPATSPAARSLVQVPEISSQSIEEDIEIIEEPVPRPLNIQPSQAPTLPGDVTSTTEELVRLNNQYGAAAATVQEYVNRMNALEVYLEPFDAMSEAMRRILAPTQNDQENSR